MSVKNKYISNPKFLLGLGLLILYSLIYFFYTRMLPWEFGSKIFGSLGGDSSQFLWNGYHFKCWLNGTEEYLKTNLLFAPFGTSLKYHTYSHLMAGTSAFLGNSFLGINIIIYLHYIFSALGAYLLARHFKVSILWSFIVGFIFAFAPYKLGHLGGHFNLQQTAFIPFFILLFFNAFPINAQESILIKFRLRNLLLLAFTGILCALSCYIYAVCLFFFAVGYLMYYALFRYIPSRKGRVVLLLLLTIGVTYLLPVIQKIGLDDKGVFWWRDDLIKYIAPPWNNQFHGAISNPFYNFYGTYGLKHSDSFLGYGFLVFSFVVVIFHFIKKPPKRIAISLFVALSAFFFMLSNPEILFMGIKLGYFPTALFHYVPVLNNMRIPERYIAMFSLCFPIMIFMMYQGVENKTLWTKTIVPLLLFLVLFVEYKPGDIYKEDSNNIPEWVWSLKKLQPGIVLPLPTGINDGNFANGNFDNHNLYYQTIHNHKLVGGYISRITDELRSNFTSNEVFVELLKLSKNEALSETIDPEKFLQFIADFKISYIVAENENSFNNFIQLSLPTESVREKIVSDTKTIYILK